MRTVHAAIVIVAVTASSLALSLPTYDGLEPAAPLRTWTIGMATKVTAWPLYQDGAVVCVLMQDATVSGLKATRLSLADQRYLKANPLPAKAVFDAERERVALDRDIDELSSRLTAMEAAQRTGAFQTRRRKAKLAALKAAYKLADAPNEL